MRPLTEGAHNWKAPWTQLVRRRSAQWGAILQADRNLAARCATAPHNYRGACCVADSAVLYQKVAIGTPEMSDTAPSAPTPRAPTSPPSSPSSCSAAARPA